ncbi:lipoprotein, partial [Escherichia coli]
MKKTLLAAGAVLALSSS